MAEQRFPSQLVEYKYCIHHDIFIHFSWVFNLRSHRIVENNNSIFFLHRGVYFAGHSAGAHLIAKLLSNSDFLDSTEGSQRLQGAFLISGIFDLREVVHTSVNLAVQLPVEWSVPLSPQFDCFTHLQARRVRVYILAGQNDSATFKRQSREFYELLHNTCLMQNMYLEIKDNYDHFDIVECFAQEDNYLRNLLVHDIRKHL